MKPFANFLVIHFEVGENTKNLEYQEAYWPEVNNLIALSKPYKANLTLQFNPQWVEYFLKDKTKLELLKKWQQEGHEIGFHHHGYDHEGWDGYTNRSGKEDDPRFRGNMANMMELWEQFVQRFVFLYGRVSRKEFTGSDKTFNLLDKNKDGYIDSTEVPRPVPVEEEKY